jgi:hypothetical protein
MSRLARKLNTVNPRLTRGIRTSKTAGSVNPRLMNFMTMTSEMYTYTFTLLNKGNQVGYSDVDTKSKLRLTF